MFDNSLMRNKNKKERERERREEQRGLVCYVYVTCFSMLNVGFIGEKSLNKRKRQNKTKK
jgi:hypothetical protein